MANPNYDALLTTTLANYKRTLEDNVFSARPLVNWLKRKDKIRTVAGGNKIVVPLLYGKNSTAGSYSGYDTIAITAQDGISAAEYPWRQYAVSIAISGIEEAMNDGEEAIIDLLESKIMQAEETVVEQMDQMFFGDGTGNSGKDWLGLAALVNNTGVVGGIDSSLPANSWWRSYVDDQTAAPKPFDLKPLRTAYNTTSKGNDTIDLILSNQGYYEKYEAALQPQERFTDSKTADGGFQNLLFKGAVWMYDEYCPAAIYFLNSKYLKLVGHKKVWFKNTPFKQPVNQDARFSQILCYGNLTISNRKRQGVVKGYTA